jgi:hypothetical protein
VVVDHRPQLFLDDALLAHTRGVTKRLHQPVKFEGNPVLVADRPWEGRTVCYGTTFFRPEHALFEKW